MFSRTEVEYLGNVVYICSVARKASASDGVVISTHQSAWSRVGRFALYCLSHCMHAVCCHWLKRIGDVAARLHLSRQDRSISADASADH